MGWQLPNPAPSLGGYATPISPTVLTTPVTITLPTAMKAGDDVWLAISSQVSVVAAMAGKGFTIIGSETNTNNGINTASCFFSVWRRTAQAGDPTSFTVTGAGIALGYNAFLVRSTTGSIATINTDAQTNNFGSAAANVVYGPFNPVAAAVDLRILFVITGNPTGSAPVAPPSVPVSDANPAGVPLRLLENWGFTTATALGAWTYVGSQADPSGADSGTDTLTWSGATANWFARWFDLTDGTSFNGGSGDETAPFQGDSGITADGARGNDTDALNAAKGRFVGGARML